MQNILFFVGCEPLFHKIPLCLLKQEMCASYLRVRPVAARRCCMFLKHSLSPSVHLKVCGAAMSYKREFHCSHQSLATVPFVLQ